MQRPMFVIITVLLTAATIGTGAATAQGAPTGVWQGVDDTDGSVVTVVVDEDDVGNVVFFAYDSVSSHCAQEQSTAFGRGWQPDPANPLWHVRYDGVYCFDGSFISLQDEYYELILDPGGIVLNVLTAAQASGQEPGGVEAYPLCRPDIDVEFEIPTGWTLIEGTDDDDTINGTKGPDVICAGKGDDRIWGRGGDDIVVGGDGADELYGNNGMDILWGGLGNDALYGGFHTDGVFGGDGDDEVKPQASADFGYGGYGADALDGFFGHDRLEGGPGDDDVWGRNGNDLLLGGTGNDFLSGGTGSNDTADGEDGRDTCNAETETNCEF